MSRRLILASASPRRSVLLAQLVGDFVIAPVPVDEGTVGHGLEPGAAAVATARAKARRAAGEHVGGVVIAADTVVDLDGVELGKPTDAAEAREMLRRMSGRRILVHTGVVVLGPDPGEELVTTTVAMRELRAEEIDRYVASGAHADKAGSLEIQGAARPFVDTVDGCWSNVVGLPLCAVGRLLDVDYRAGVCEEPPR